MAATGVGMRVVTSTLEFLSSYSYLGAEPVFNQDRAYEQLRPLGEAAQALFRERDHFRGEMTRLQKELETQKELTKVYGSHLQELIRRVETQPHATPEALLQGIKIPPNKDQAGIVSELLQDIQSLQLQLSGSHTSEQESLSLKTESELPAIHEYLEDAVQKSKDAFGLYRRAELTNKPSPEEAWDRVLGLLKTQEQARIPFVQVVKAKAKALRTLKSIETLSLEQALAHNEVIKSQMMKILCESETWVISEVAHERIERTPQLEDAIKRRIELIQKPWTIETAQELTEIHEYYEYLRHQATLKPWIERVQPEFDWWKVVGSAVKLSDVSLEGLKEIAVRLHVQEREQVVEGLQDQVVTLRRQITPDTEGSFHFLTGILEKLTNLEDLKMSYLKNLDLNQEPQTSFFTQFKSVTHEFINFLMIFATFGDEPLNELLTINSKLDREDSDITNSLRILASELKTKVIQKLSEKISPKWISPLLQASIGVSLHLESSEAQARKEAIEGELKFIEANEQMAQDYLVEHRNKIVRYVSASISLLEHLNEQKAKQLQDANAQLQKNASDAARTQRELETLKSKFDECSGRLQEACSKLATSIDSRAKATGEQCLKTLESSKSSPELIQKFSLISEAVNSFLALPVESEEVKVPGEAVEKEVNSVLSVAISLLEEVNKASLLAYGRQTFESSIKVGNPLNILTEKVRFLGTSLSELRGVLKSKSPGDISFLLKLRHTLDLSCRNAEDLAKGFFDPDNESRTREKVLETRKNMVEAAVGDLAVMMGNMEELVREQVARRLSDDFKEAEVCEENATPVSPSKRAHAVPTSPEKLTKGMDFLTNLVGHMLSSLKVDLDSEQLRVKHDQITQASGQEKLLLQEAVLHWELKEVLAKLTNEHQSLLHKACKSVETLSTKFQDPENLSELLSELATIRKEGEQGTVSGVELLNRAQELMDKGLVIFISEQNTKKPEPAGTISQRIIEKIGDLLHAYERELAVHSIIIDVTAEEEANLKATGEEKQIFAQLSTMERGLTAISEKATVHKKELKDTKTYIVEQSKAITEVQLFTLKTMSLEDFSMFQAKESTMDDHIIGILNTANAVNTVVSKTFGRLKAFNAPVQYPDLISHLEVLIGPPKLQESTEEMVSEGQGEARTPPRETQLRGIPTKPSPYSVINKAAGASLEAALEVLDLHHLDSLVRTGREVLTLAISEGDPVGIIGQKLEFVKDSLLQFKTTYGKGQGEKLNPIFEQVMINLTTAKGLMKNEGNKKQVGDSLKQITDKANANKADVLVCLEMAETTLRRVLGELKQSEQPFEVAGESLIQEKQEETKTKLAAVPSASDKLGKGMGFILKQTGHILSTLSLAADPATIDQLQMIEEAAGQDKLIMQQALLHSELKRIHTTLKSTFDDLLKKSIDQVRFFGYLEGSESEIESTLGDIEHNAGLNGADLEVIKNVGEILDYIVESYHPPEPQEFTSTEVQESAESPKVEASKLSAVPTTGDKLSKGMSFIMKEMGHLLSVLEVPLTEDMREQLQRIDEAVGQDKLILQQALLHSEIKRTVTQIQAIFRDLLHRLITDVRQCSSVKGTSQEIEPTLVEVEENVEHNGVNLESLYTMEQILGYQASTTAKPPEFESAGGITSGEAQVQEQTKLAAAPTSGDKLEKGMGFLMKQAGHLLEFLNLSQGEQEIEQLRQIEGASGQDKLILQQGLLHSELKRSVAQVHKIFDDLLHRLVRDVQVSSSIRGTSSETEPTLAAIEGKVASNGLNSETLSALEQVLYEQVSRILPQVEFEATEGTTSGEAPVQEQTKLSAVPTSGDKLEKGMGFLMKQAGHLLEFLNLSQGEQEIEQLRQIGAASGQDKLILQQGLLHSELKRSVTQIRTIFDDLLHRLVRDVQMSSSIRGTSSETEPTLASITGSVQGNGVNSEALSALEQVLYEQVSRILPQVEFEATEGTTSGEAPVLEQTKLSAVPTSGDKLEKGMGFLMKQAGHLLEFLSLSQGEQEIEQLRQIGAASGQDKLILQQGLLHSELKRVREELKNATSYLLKKLFSHAEYLLVFVDPEPRREAEVRFSPIKSAIEGEQINIRPLIMLTEELLVEQERIRLNTETEYEVVEVQESVENQPEEQSKLSSLPTVEEPLEKGMESLLTQVDLLLHSLELVPSELDRSKLGSAMGQEKLILQQTLVHTELQQIQDQIKKNLKNLTERQIATIKKLRPSNTEQVQAIQEMEQRAVNLTFDHALYLEGMLDTTVASLAEKAIDIDGEIAHYTQVAQKAAELYEALKQVKLEEVQKTVNSTNASPLSVLNCALQCFSILSAALQEATSPRPPPSYAPIHRELELLFPRLKEILKQTLTEFDIEAREQSANAKTGDAKAILQIRTLRDGLGALTKQLKATQEERDQSRKDTQQRLIRILQLLGQGEAAKSVSEDTLPFFEIIETQLTDMQGLLKSLNPSVESENEPLGERMRMIVDELERKRIDQVGRLERNATQLLDSLKQLLDFVPNLEREGTSSEISILSAKADPTERLESVIKFVPRMLQYVGNARSDAGRDAEELKVLRVQLSKLVAIDPSVRLSGVGAKLVDEVQRLCKFLDLPSDRTELFSTLSPKVQSVSQELKTTSHNLDTLKKQLSGIMQYIGGDMIEDEQRESSIITRLQKLYSDITQMLGVPESRIKEALGKLLDEHREVETWVDEVKGIIAKHLSYCRESQGVDWADCQAAVSVEKEESFFNQLGSLTQSEEAPVCLMKLLYEAHRRIRQELIECQEARTKLTSNSQKSSIQTGCTETVHMEKTISSTVSTCEKGEASHSTVRSMQVETTMTIGSEKGMSSASGKKLIEEVKQQPVTPASDSASKPPEEVKSEPKPGQS